MPTVWLVRRLVRRPPLGRCAHQEEGIDQISTTTRQAACSGWCRGPAARRGERQADTSAGAPTRYRPAAGRGFSTTSRQATCSGRSGEPAAALVERRPRQRAAVVCRSLDPIETGSGLRHLDYYEAGSLQRPNFSYCASASNWSAIGSPQLQQRSRGARRRSVTHLVASTRGSPWNTKS